MSVEEIKDDGFDEGVLQSEQLVLVDFWAPWCAPCRTLMPIVREAAKKYEGSVRVVKMNIDDSPGTSSKYSIKSIPTLLLFKNGETVEKLVGLQNLESIDAAVSKHI